MMQKNMFQAWESDQVMILMQSLAIGQETLNYLPKDVFMTGQRGCA